MHNLFIRVPQGGFMGASIIRKVNTNINIEGDIKEENTIDFKLLY